MFGTLTGIFYWVGLKMNICKTVVMVCHPCQAARIRVDKAYTRWTTGADITYKKGQKEWFICCECGKDLVRGSLDVHCQTQHGVAKGDPVQEGKIEVWVNKPRTYRMSFPNKEGPRPFPVEGCSGQVAIRTFVKVQFWHRHVRDTVVIMDERNIPHP